MAEWDTTKYPEGMSIEVTWSPTTRLFTASAILNDEDELVGFQNYRVSDALSRLADWLRDKYEI